MQSLISNFHIQSIIFVIVLGFFVWYAFSIIYHFIRFGIGITTKILALIFFIGSLFLFTTSILMYSQIDWLGTAKSIFNNFKNY